MLRRVVICVAIICLTACNKPDAVELRSDTQVEPNKFDRAAFSCEPGEVVPFRNILNGHRAILVGEMHGTTEMPAAFGNMVAQAASTGKRIAVALEFDRRWQADVNAVMAAPDQASAEAAFASRATFDGRTSAAMRNLLYSLRELKHAGLDVQVFAIDFWQRAEETEPYLVPAWLPEEVDVSGALRDIRMGEKAVSDCLSIRCDVLMYFAGNMHTRPIISESFTLNVETGEQTPFTTAPAGAIIAHEMPTAAVYLVHSGGSIRVNTGDGLRTHHWASSVPDYVGVENTFFCTSEDSKHGFVYNVGPITASSDPTQPSP